MINQPKLRLLAKPDPWFRQFHLGPLCLHISGDLVWLRFGDVGLYCKDTRKMRPSFSERYGYKRTWRIGPYLIGTLEPMLKLKKEEGRP